MLTRRVARTNYVGVLIIVYMYCYENNFCGLRKFEIVVHLYTM